MYKSYNLKITPFDNMFFRDAHTFQKEMSHYIPTLRQPYPSTIYGALLSCFLRQGLFSNILKDIQGKKLLDETLKEHFRIKNVFLIFKDEVFLKAPLDTFYNDKKVQIGRYKSCNGVFQCHTPVYDKEELNQVDNHYISLKEYKEHYLLNKNIHSINLLSEKDVFSSHTKIGIELNAVTGSVKEKHLYKIEQISFKDKDWSYFLQVDLKEDTGKIKDDVLKLGGENKLAYLKTLPSQDILEEDYNNIVINEKTYYTDKIKMILTTPMKNDTYNALCEKVNVIGQVTGKSLTIGGYNMLKNSQKKLTKAIPSGSILILQSNTFNRKSIKEITKTIKSQYTADFKGFDQFIIAPLHKEG
ncbi:CRISPR-associated protein Cmr3 [Natranaerovirga hydrolytica]|uniref:CRISPR-associated protein Cmr3 n=1 Tax=Natranaerovirga hydrolytica TaxID=680378 RepID=A0A4R1N7M7_9FIRM|nr:type III-B CRISPR module-associated Cmr3 family protein [Natranaerovirga hydrolytica]TCK98673.1 CRISPR-associated protein Cmr3 [Natranaerovirga hydrolytica]